MAEWKKDKFQPFKLGQILWLDTQNVKMHYHRKMALKWEEPFKVTQVMGPLTFKLKLPESWRIHDMFHAVLLMPYTEMETHRPNFLRLPPDIDNNEEWWEIEAIINHRRQGCKHKFLIKWKGYDITEAMWEPNMCFNRGGEEILKEYCDLHNLPIWIPWHDHSTPHHHFDQPRKMTHSFMASTAEKALLTWLVSLPQLRTNDRTRSGYS